MSSPPAQAFEGRKGAPPSTQQPQPPPQQQQQHGGATGFGGSGIVGRAVAAAVLAQFESLGKGGKPQPHEHTVLAGIAVTLPAGGPVGAAAAAAATGVASTPSAPAQPQQAQQAQQAPAPPQQQHPPQQPSEQQQRPVLGPVVLALATGTKCLPGSRRDPSGRALNDCHAEVVCRRALLGWLYREMLEAVRLYRTGQRDGTVVLRLQQCERGRSPLEAGAVAPGLDLELPAMEAPAAVGQQQLEEQQEAPWAVLPGWCFKLRPGVQLHMYVSQPPCGDASILKGLEGSSLAGSCCSGQALAPTGQPAAAAAAGAVTATAEATAAGSRAGSGARAPAVPAGPNASLGRTGAKPIKRPKLAHAQHPTSQPPTQPPPGEQPCSAEQRPCGQQQGERQGHPLAGTLGAAGSAGAAWGVPQAHEVESYAQAQAAGVVRRKPGRGEATLSMSCSDKLARWRLLGLQGSLLSALLAAPLHLSSFTATVVPPAEPIRDASGPAAACAADAAGTAGGGVVEGSAAAQSSEGVVAAAEASLRRALVGRTECLSERLLGPFRGVVPPLAITAHCPAATAGAAPGAGNGELGRERLEALGLVPGGARKVPGGSTLVWHAPPSTQLLEKGALNTVAARRQQGCPQAQQEAPRQQQGQQAGPRTLPAAGQAAEAAVREGSAVLLVKSGTQEAVAGMTGVKLGQSRKGAAAPPPSAAPGVCKEALLRLFLQVVGELAALPDPGGGQAEAASGAAAGGAAGAEAAVRLLGSCSYQQAKHVAGAAYQAAWRRVLGVPGGPFEGWIPKPGGLEAFVLKSAGE